MNSSIDLNRYLIAILIYSACSFSCRSQTVTPSILTPAEHSPIVMPCGPGNLVTGDLNKDGNVDLVVACGETRTLTIFKGLGNGQFEKINSPLSFPYPPNELVIGDINSDGHQDLLVASHDSYTITILRGDGTGKFTTLSSAKSGFYVPGDAKALVRLPVSGSELFLASQNRDSVMVFQQKHQGTGSRFIPKTFDVRAELRYADGRKQSVEFYYGSGYLSQSTRAITVPQGVSEIVVYNSQGESRRVAPDEM